MSCYVAAPALLLEKSAGAVRVIAESRPEEKDVMVALAMHFLKRGSPGRPGALCETDSGAAARMGQTTAIISRL